MTFTRFGFNIPSFTYPGIDDSDLFDAARLGAELRDRRNMSMEKYRGYAIEGDRAGVCEQVAALFDAGLDGLIFNMHDSTDLGAIAEAGAVLRDNFGDSPSR